MYYTTWLVCNHYIYTTQYTTMLDYYFADIYNKCTYFLGSLSIQSNAAKPHILPDPKEKLCVWGKLRSNTLSGELHH